MKRLPINQQALPQVTPMTYFFGSHQRPDVQATVTIRERTVLMVTNSPDSHSELVYGLLELDQAFSDASGFVRSYVVAASA